MSTGFGPPEFLHGVIAIDRGNDRVAQAFHAFDGIRANEGIVLDDQHGLGTVRQRLGTGGDLCGGLPEPFEATCGKYIRTVVPKPGSL